MNVLVALRFAVRGLGANKLRSMLTTLGILIGVASVIVLLAVGTGSTAAVKANISKLGTNTLTVNRSAAGTAAAAVVSAVLAELQRLRGQPPGPAPSPPT